VRTLKASTQGLEKIKHAREQKGLVIEDFKWLLEASKVLEPNIDWEDRGCFADGVSLSTFRRFLYGIKPIKAPAFQAYSQVLGLNCEELTENDNQNPVASPFYVQRKSIENPEYLEARCYEEIQKPGSLTRIKAPEQMGKTWLLEKVLGFARENGYQTVKLDFRLADSTIFSDYDTFLQWVCLHVGEELDIEENIDQYWKKMYGSNKNCTRYFQKHLLSNINAPMVFGLDNVDLVFEQPDIFDNFCKLIRYWYDQAKSTDNIGEIWKKIRFVIVHSTEVYRAMDINSSPLAGVGLTVEPPDFKPEQVLSLAQQHELNWNSADIEKLMMFIGGNPALVHKAVDSAKQQNLSVEELLKSAATESGVFRDHLGKHLHNLRQYPQLASAFLLCVNSQEPVDIDSQLAFKLHRMGLVKLQENCVTPSCNLYRQYYSSRL
jgi:AAA-like domain